MIDAQKFCDYNLNLKCVCGHTKRTHISEYAQGIACKDCWEARWQIRNVKGQPTDLWVCMEFKLDNISYLLSKHHE